MVSGLFAEEEENLFIDGIEDEVDALIASDEGSEITPRNNTLLVGHEDTEKELLKDFYAGRMPHAIVLSGAPGIGKATFAYRLAKFLLAQSQDTGPRLFEDRDEGVLETMALPSDHPVIRRVLSGGHADLLVVEREFDEKKGRLKNDIAVESVRRVHPFLRKTAAEGGWRVVIVDGAENLNASSQNALLKILEEPPKKTVLILTTSQPGAFLPTIRSRCRMVALKPLSDKNMGLLLEEYVPAIDRLDRDALIAISEGSIGQALQFHDDDGMTLYKDILKLAETLPEMDILLANAVATKAGRYGAERMYATAKQILLNWCDRIVRASARGVILKDILPGDSAIFQTLVDLYSPHHFMRVWEELNKLFYQADQYNLDKQRVMMQAFLILHDPKKNLDI